MIMCIISFAKHIVHLKKDFNYINMLIVHNFNEKTPKT